MISQFWLLKVWLVDATGVSKDSLHIHVALLLMFGTALMFRRPLTSVRPWGVVMAAALLGEVGDYLTPSRPPEWKGMAAHDIINTMFWPTAICVGARIWPRLNPRSITRP